MSEILLVNPRKRKRRAKKKRVARRKKTAVRRRRRNPVARKRTVRRRRRRSNPNLSARGITKHIQTASTGALGALGLDIALAYIPLPAQITGGIVGKITKMVGAVALGVVANRFLGVSAANANRMTEGALTVQLHGIGRELLAQFAPGVALSAYMQDDGLGYYGSGWNPNVPASDLGTYLPDISADGISVDQTGFGMYEAEPGNNMGAYF